MKKVKLILWLIILVFFGLLGFQNKALFLQQNILVLDLYVIEKMETPELALAVFFAFFFLLGLIIAYFFSLYGKFKSNQTIKGLNQKIDSFMEKNSKLEAENESLKAALMEKSGEIPSGQVPVELTEKPEEEVKEDRESPKADADMDTAKS